ncbi:hypothetical protein BDV29DRAFT_175201 [Aspergillus leporis]|uniref:Uncharacterized protein n=1 Tax=Aspergillus leporis TaxID=41062 RepID=A0A5N5X0S3_9EURO|nr:hypothetical protein BDV29DRAFT_175201 [Aspergillus leporis]
MFRVAEASGHKIQSMPPPGTSITLFSPPLQTHNHFHRYVTQVLLRRFVHNI